MKRLAYLGVLAMYSLGIVFVFFGGMDAGGYLYGIGVGMATVYVMHRFDPSSPGRDPTTATADDSANPA